jgi:ABC-type glycerol-3-phosphate transport system substrate-binding protein
MESLSADVLVPISPEQLELVRATLSDEDRSRLIDLGVAHVPTTSGTPWYESAARVAIVNRASPRAELAARFLRFLASEEYNEQINQTFDSICGMPEYCEDSDGISGPPEALPGLEAFDSPVFVDAMAKYAHPWELSPFIGRGRLGILTGPVLEGLTNNTIGPGEAARLIEERINEQIHANLVRDDPLRAEWERRVGKAFDQSRGVKEQVIEARGGAR